MQRPLAARLCTPTTIQLLGPDCHHSEGFFTISKLAFCSSSCTLVILNKRTPCQLFSDTKAECEFPNCQMVVTTDEFFCSRRSCWNSRQKLDFNQTINQICGETEILILLTGPCSFLAVLISTQSHRVTGHSAKQLFPCDSEKQRFQ